MTIDHYQTLGLERTATQAEIKRSYKRLAREHHPDLNSGSIYAERKFKEVTEAYAVLSNPGLRRAYEGSQHNIEKTSPTVDPKKKKDLETIINAVTRVASSPVPYEDFFDAYKIYRSLNQARDIVERYVKSPASVNITEVTRLKQIVTADLERLSALADRNYIGLGKLVGLIIAYRKAQSVAEKYDIDLPEELIFMR